jgi:hypothetical protein
MRYWKYIRSLRIELVFLFTISLTTIFLIDFWLINIPELFNGGSKLGVVIYRLCLSFISAFIFYFLVVHIKHQQDKDNLYAYISKKVSMVIGSGIGMANEIAKANDIKLEGKFPTKEQLTEICKTINPYSKAPLLLGGLDNYANWLQYFDYYKQRSNDATQKVYVKIHFLESELVKLLADLEDCSHFIVLKHVLGTQMKNDNLTAFESGIWDYFELVKKLDTYYLKHLVRYK